MKVGSFSQCLQNFERGGFLPLDPYRVDRVYDLHFREIRHLADQI